jgi:putative transposase
MKYRFIQVRQREFRVTQLCQVLQVNRSGFHAWQHRAPSLQSQADQTLRDRMQVLHQKTREACRARKMWQLLKREALGRGTMTQLNRFTAEDTANQQLHL